METIIFTTEQFNSGTRVIKAELIENSINVISSEGIVTIDNTEYRSLTDFIYWLIDTL